MYKIVHLQYLAKLLVKSKHKITRYKTKYKSFATILNIKNNRNNNKLTENQPRLFNKYLMKNQLPTFLPSISCRVVLSSGWWNTWWQNTEYRFKENDRRVQHTWKLLGNNRLQFATHFRVINPQGKKIDWSVVVKCSTNKIQPENVILLLMETSNRIRKILYTNRYVINWLLLLIFYL